MFPGLPLALPFELLPFDPFPALTINPSRATFNSFSALITSSSVASSLFNISLAEFNFSINTLQDSLVYFLESKPSALFIKSSNLSLLGFNLNSKNNFNNSS